MLFADEIGADCALVAEGNEDRIAQFTIQFSDLLPDTGCPDSGANVVDIRTDTDTGEKFVVDVARTGANARTFTLAKAFVDLSILMTQCDDEVTIAETPSTRGQILIQTLGGDDYVTVGGGAGGLDQGFSKDLTIDGGTRYRASDTHLFFVLYLLFVLFF